MTAGVASGLTLGYMSLDELQLELKLQNGTAEEKKMAQSILPVLHEHHKILVTLMITNALAME
jgi:metal transporter CNNM